MDHASEELLKCDLLVHGLALKWQKKVLPSVATFTNALHQAQAAEKQTKQLNEIYKTTAKAVRTAGAGHQNRGSTKARKEMVKVPERADMSPGRKPNMRAKCLNMPARSIECRIAPNVSIH